jgi:hypothetical protein
MIFSNHSRLKLSFEIGRLRDQSMGLEFINAGNTQRFDSLDDDTFVYETTITFPTSMTIRVFNKQRNDTLVDEQGNIIKDKYIKLLDIQVDGVSCSPYYVSKYVILNTADGRALTTNYWGFNGTVLLDFTEDNSFYWAVHTYNKALKPS